MLGIFQMPRRDYAIGVSGSGDAWYFIVKGEKFLARYKDLKVMLVASRSSGETLEGVKKIAQKNRATLRFVETRKISGTQARNDAIEENLAEIKRLLPK